MTHYDTDIIAHNSVIIVTGFQVADDPKYSLLCRIASAAHGDSDDKNAASEKTSNKYLRYYPATVKFQCPSLSESDISGPGLCLPSQSVTGHGNVVTLSLTPTSTSKMYRSHWH